ncbi:MAG: carboxypeptidase-like regulatory domain-containing protein [Bacteroidota bacterium]
MVRILLFFLAFFSALMVHGQRFLKGTVKDKEKRIIPYAKIYVKNDPTLRTVCDVNGYYEMGLMPGEYYLVVTATGYEDREYYLGMADADINKDFQLFPPNVKTVEDVVVSVKKSNPGREIMLKVVNKRDSINPWNRPHQVNVYIKASEKLDFKSSGKSRKKKAMNPILKPKRTAF